MIGLTSMMKNMITMKIVLVTFAKMKGSIMLTYNEEQVLTMRFGLAGKKPMMLQEVGKILDCTRERVRQIEAIGLRKLNLPKIVNITFPQYADMVKRSMKLNDR
jgi:DNA-directed RNA polymerase sigma subunit (sigma70/sigma32)